MKFVFKFLLIIFLLFSNKLCAQSNEIANDSIWIASYYLMDDNWSDETDTSLINAWKQEKILHNLQHGPTRSIFEHKGAGMNGTQWNPETSIFCIGRIRNEEKLPFYSVSVQFFDEKYGTVPTTHLTKDGEAYFQITIPREDWQKYLRPVTTENMNSVYRDQPLLTAQWKSAQKGEGEYHGFDLILGQYVEINFNLRSENSQEFRISKVLHALFGE